MWSIWSRQTVEGAGPGVGMVLAAVAVLVLAVVWFRLAVTRE
jgi:membrane-associated protease RseP (regulator of RpoE activity)